jgi:hypothetical protein
MLGDWDTAEAELTRAADADGLADDEYLACYRGLLAALRGDTATAQITLAGLADLRASEDPLDKSLVSLVEAFTAATRGRPQDALRRARGTLTHVGAIGISGDAPPVADLAFPGVRPVRGMMYQAPLAALYTGRARAPAAAAGRTGAKRRIRGARWRGCG